MTGKSIEEIYNRGSRRSGFVGSHSTGPSGGGNGPKGVGPLLILLVILIVIILAIAGEGSHKGVW